MKSTTPHEKIESKNGESAKEMHGRESMGEKVWERSMDEKV